MERLEAQSEIFCVLTGAETWLAAQMVSGLVAHVESEVLVLQRSDIRKISNDIGEGTRGKAVLGCVPSGHALLRSGSDDLQCVGSRREVAMSNVNCRLQSILKFFEGTLRCLLQNSGGWKA